MINVKYTQVLIDKLHERFKNELPTEEQTLFELGKLVGQQDAIKYIESIVEFEEQGKKL